MSEPESEAAPKAPLRTRSVAVPQSGSRLTLAAVLGVVLIVVAIAAVPEGVARVVALVFVAPLFPLALTFFVGMAPRFFAERAAARSARRTWKKPLADASKRSRPVTLSGRLQPKVAIRSPMDVECAAWIARKESRGHIVQASQVAEAVLKTKRYGEIPLETGSWRLANAFDPFDEKGEATIAAGEPVVMRARVQSFNVRGDGYRDNTLAFRLAAGGIISPKAGRYARRAVAEVRWLRSGAVVALATFALALAVLGVSSIPRRDSEEHSPAIWVPSATTPYMQRCDDKRECPGALVCDVESMLCVEAIQGQLAEGAACKAEGDCGPGLRCRPDYASGLRSLRCSRICRADSECNAGDWCVPCAARGQAMSTDGDCTPSSNIAGAMGAVCKTVHGELDAE